MRWLVASIIALGLASSGAEAGPGPEDAAQVHLDRGIAAFRAGDFAGARHELEAAHELAPERANPYRWLALTAVQLGDCATALANIDDFLARVPPDDDRRPELTRLRELCERTGVLAVDSQPTAATLRIDGAVVGKTPFRSLSMRAGTHALEAELAGHTPASRSVVVPARGEVAVRLELAARRRPLVRRWWFWAAIGGAAVAITATTIVLASGSGVTELPPLECGPTGCSVKGSR